jgi:hypothetical protein
MKKIYFIPIVLLVALFSFKSVNNLKVSSNDSAIQTGPQFVHLLRYYNAHIGRHIYTTNPNELTAASGYVYENTVGTLYGSGWVSNPTGGIISAGVYRYYNSSTRAHFCSLGGTKVPSGFSFEGLLGYQVPYPLFTMNYNVGQYHNPSGDYFYKTDISTETTPGYTSDGDVFYVTNN